ncbi:DMT family transporter [Klebsiella aerogenes]|uniref:DMT family transporter n=1 Tax=Klebsiella aerogenes TaxID=548 RepID=UPI003AAC6012
MHNRRASTSISGWINGFIGVAIFSGSLPATRIAVQEFDPFFLTFCRGAIAGVLALGLIWLLRLPRPQAGQWRSLALVAGGVVIGFPLLTALALQRVTSAHSIVFIGLLPLATAIFAVIRGGERPRPAFWGFSLLGSVLVASFALAGNVGISVAGDLLMLAAVVVCGLGYAEGARLTRELGGLAVICWALLLSLPLMVLACGLTIPISFSGISASAWTALAYVSLCSMLVGFIFWYRGLAIGGIAAVGQLQLLQPFFGLALAALLLHESVSPLMVVVTLGIIFCVIGSKRFAR